MQEVNNGIARHGGRLQLGQLDPEGVEKWVTTKKAQVNKQGLTDQTSVRHYSPPTFKPICQHVA